MAPASWPRAVRSALSAGGSGDWGLTRTFLATFGVIALGMVFLGRTYFFGPPLYETADLAANSLQITGAGHFSEILGNYSRFGFHHPGPAFFYVYAAGQSLFYDVLHAVPAPHNGQLLAGALLQAAFLAIAISVLAKFASPNRLLFVAAAIGLALVEFQLAGSPEFSIWPPDQIVVPFACFLCVAMALACGRLSLLPLLVLCGGFLVHGHVAEPLFVGPIGIVAYGLALWKARRDSGLAMPSVFSRSLLPHLVAGGLLALFLVPLVLDAIKGADSNLAAVVAGFTAPRGPSDRHSVPSVLAYMTSFLGYPADLRTFHFTTVVRTHLAGFAFSGLVLFALPVGMYLTRPRPSGSGAEALGGSPGSGGTVAGSFFFPVALFILALSVGLMFVWDYIQRGTLFEFNSFITYGLMYVAALPSLVAIGQRWPVDRARLAAVAVSVAAVVLTVVTVVPLPMDEDPAGLPLATDLQHVLAQRSPTAPAVLLEFEHKDWPWATAVALQLQRGDVTWYVEPDWGFMFGSQHVFESSAATPTVEKWYLTPPAAGQTGQIDLGGTIALYPPPPSLDGIRASP